MNDINYYQNNRPEMIQFLPENYKTVLEIGCGSGVFYKNLNPDCEYLGVELESKAIEHADKNLTILQGTIESQYDNIKNDHYDLIICNDVIEHIDNLEIFLKKLNEKLNQNGTIVLSIPNVRYLNNLKEVLFKKDWEYKEEGILDKTHLRFFTKKSIRRLFHDNGFNIEQIQGINSILEGKYFHLRLSRTIRHGLLLALFGFDTQYQQFAVKVKKS